MKLKKKKKIEKQYIEDLVNDMYFVWNFFMWGDLSLSENCDWMQHHPQWQWTDRGK